MHASIDASSAATAWVMPVSTARLAAAFPGGSYRSSSEETSRAFARSFRLLPLGSRRCSVASLARRLAFAYSTPYETSRRVSSGLVSWSCSILVAMPALIESALIGVGGVLFIAYEPRTMRYVRTAKPFGAGYYPRDFIIAVAEPTRQKNPAGTRRHIRMRIRAKTLAKRSYGVYVPAILEQKNSNFNGRQIEFAK